MWSGWFRSQKLTDFIIERASGGKSEPADTAQKLEAGAKVALTGKLQGGMMAIGGETTGWQLTYTKGGKPARIEVDMRAIKNAGDFDGARVEVSGKIVSKQYVERGEVSILKAERVVKEP